VKAFRHAQPTRTDKEASFADRLEAAAESSQTSNVERFSNFPLWAPRQSIARFLAQYEIYKEHILPAHGSIIECGTYFGGGTMAWAHLASIFEPVNHTRRVVSFDTFSGFPGMTSEDAKAESGLNFKGGMATPLDGEIAELTLIHDSNRPIGHIPRVELVKGDACETIPAYVQANPHLLVAALILEFDIYAPTKKALNCLLPLMPKGAVIIWDELGCKDWPGETTAYLSKHLEGWRLRRLPFTSTLSYCVVGE
jgi:hypothetical protein